MMVVPAGGPSTINGVLYQMLWALCRIGTLQAEMQDVDQATGELVSVCLILEPAEGGDQQEVRRGGRVVEQLKARSSGKPWSLQEVILEVLPDLYRAVDLKRSDTEYRFVTEGHAGDWQSVRSFFESLKSRTPVGDILSELDDAEELKFGQRARASKDPERKPFWEGSFTQRRMFQKIMEVLRRRKDVAEEPLGATSAKLWHLLANFTFVEGRTALGLRVAIDSWLSAIVPALEDLNRYRDALLLDLARRATTGGARIVAAEFLAEHGLTAPPLSNWASISERGRNLLAAYLRLRGFDAADNARPDLTGDVAERWTLARPILVLTGIGGGGHGKTWLGYSLLDRAAERQEVALAVEATGDGGQDLANAAAVFWQHVIGQDNSPPFVRIADRLRIASPGSEVRPLCLLVDNVTDVAEARQLALEHWEQLGMRLVVTCPPEVAAAIRQAAPNRFVEFTVQNFSAEELHRYLSACVGENWPQIPGDVRAVLRRPLLACIYRDLAGSVGWQPTREYELYDRCWQDLFDRKDLHPQDVVPLYRLVRSLLNGANYPWTAEQADAAGFDSDRLDRLRRAGWLRTTSDRCYEVWHDRLLNWTLARALVSEIQGERSTAPAAFARLRELLEGRQLVAGRNLGYVPMDFIWLLASADPMTGLKELVAPAVAEIERAAGGRLLEQIYSQLLPTVGPAILSHLFERLRAAAQLDNGYLAKVIAAAIARFDPADIGPPTLSLLSDEMPFVQRAAVWILAKSPVAEALDRLWQLHCARHHNPGTYQREGEHDTTVYKEFFDALRACVRLDVRWLEATIQRVDATREPVSELAFLVANLHDGGASWRRCKQVLHAKVPTDKERSIATNILVYLDNSEIDWLCQRIHRSSDLLGAVALRALIRIAPELALQELDRLSEWQLYTTRHWTMREFLVRTPGPTTQHLYHRLVQHQTPWLLGDACEGHELYISAPMLEVLLDSTASLLAEDLHDPLLQPQSPRARRALMRLHAIASPNLLECFWRRCEQPLEHNLTNWLNGRNAQPETISVYDEGLGLRVLAKIGGPGLTAMVNRLLQKEKPSGWMEGLRFAVRRPDATTIELLAALSVNEDISGSHPYYQGLAATALGAARCWREIVAYLVRWGLAALDDVCNYRHEAGNLSDEMMMPALSLLQAGHTPAPGIILALGFGNRKDYLDYIRETLSRTDSDSDLATACAMALGWLKDDDNATVLIVQRKKFDLSPRGWLG